jgi:hypothetical protein
MSKKKPRPRNYGKTPDQLAPYDFIQHCSKLLKARVKAGVYRDRPGLESAITEFDPAIALIEIASDPNSTPDMRAAVSAKLMPYWHKEQSLLIKEAGSGNAPVTISLVIAPWAAGPQGRPPPTPALPERDDTDETIITPDMPRTYSSPPSPPLSDRERLRAQLLAARETVVMDVPPQPDKQPTVLGRVNPGRPYEMSDSEKQRIMEVLSRGPQQ